MSKNGERADLVGSADTVLIEPDEGRVTMTWRVAHPLRKNMLEVEEIIVGRRGPEWWQQRGGLAFPIPILVEAVAGEELEEVLDEDQ